MVLVIYCSCTTIFFAYTLSSFSVDFLCLRIHIHHEFLLSSFASCTHWEKDSPRRMHSQINEGQRKISQSSELTQKTYMLEFTAERVKTLIFFSNRIESSGLSSSDTYKLLDTKRSEDIREVECDRKKEAGSSETVLHKQHSQMRVRREVLQLKAMYRFLCVEHLHEPLRP